MHFRIQVVIAFILFFATAALSGIIGNRADALLMENLPPLLSSEVTINAIWIGFVVLLVLALVVFIVTSYETTIRNASNLTKIRDNITRNVSPLYTPIPHREDAEQVARQITRSNSPMHRRMDISSSEHHSLLPMFSLLFLDSR